MEGLVAGDVVVVDYPYTDLSTTKRRPALIVATLPGTSNAIFCQITSQFTYDSSAVTLTDEDFETGALTQPISNIRPNYLHTLDVSLAIRRVGHLRDDRLGVVLEAIRAFFVI
jgi:mRNA interferase MazF